MLTVPLRRVAFDCNLGCNHQNLTESVSLRIWTNLIFICTDKHDTILADFCKRKFREKRFYTWRVNARPDAAAATVVVGVAMSNAVSSSSKRPPASSVERHRDPSAVGHQPSRTITETAGDFSTVGSFQPALPQNTGNFLFNYVLILPSRLSCRPWNERTRRHLKARRVEHVLAVFFQMISLT